MKKSILLFLFLSFAFAMTAQQSAIGDYGIGVSFRIFNDTVIVMEVMNDGPAKRSGIQANDRIVTIDGMNATGDSARDDFMFRNLRGQKGTVVTLGIFRNGEVRDSRIVRELWIPTNTQSEWETYFLNNIQKLDPIEGIWSMSITDQRSHSGRTPGPVLNISTNVEITIYKSGNVFKAHTNIPLTFRNTAVAGVYLFEFDSYTFFRAIHGDGPSSRNPRPTTSRGNAVLTNGLVLEFGFDMQWTWEDRNIDRRGRVISDNTSHWRSTFEYQFIKLFPTATSSTGSPSSEVSGSGTGWALSRQGHIVTNYHVIEGAKDIQVRGINGDFSKTHKAKVVIQDIVNDLAIIQIEQPNFVLQDRIPYTITTPQVSVGSNIFVLGYPLRSTMGDEVKLTNGIISSRSGFQGDITNYQISAPVQPGNSGGPLFDDKGNIIGIVTAKHIGAENASYAVKASYLMKLIESMDSPPTLLTTNTISSQSLADQVKTLRRFVYIIEVK